MAALNRAALVVAVLAAVAAARAEGQASHALVLSAHAQRMDQRDERVSPLKYRGTLPGGTAGYRRTRAAEVTTLDLALSAGTLGASRGGREWLAIGQVRASHLWRVLPGFFTGAEVAADLRAIDHQYLGAADEVFETSVVSMAPAVRWDPAFHDALHMRAAVTAVAWLRHSYSRVKAGNQGGFHVVGPRSWREGYLEVNREVAKEKRVAWRLGYRLAIRALDRREGYAAVENRVHVAGIVRLAP